MNLAEFKTRLTSKVERFRESLSKIKVNWKKNWHTHNPYWFVVAIVLFIGSISFVVLGVNTLPPIHDRNLSEKLDTINSNIAAILNTSIAATNQSLNNLGNTNGASFSQSKTGESYFTLPSLFPPQTFDIGVSCTINSGNFVQNNPSIMNVALSLGPTVTAELDILHIDVKAVDALEGYYDWSSPTGYTIFDPPLLGDTNLNPTQNAAITYWSGTIGSVYFPMFLQDEGPLKLEITIFMSPQSNMLNSTDLSTFHPDFNATVTIPTIYIESGQSVQVSKNQQQQLNLLNQTLIQQQLQQQEGEKGQIQQQISSDWSIALAYLVLFFAVFEIAITVLDHSKDDDRKAEYEKRKTNENNKQNF